MRTVAASPITDYLPAVSEHRHQFWQGHPGLSWSNPQADDCIHIRAALLRPRFDRLLDIAVEFGLERLRREWSMLSKENNPETRQARSSVERILNNLEEGFSRAAAGN